MLNKELLLMGGFKENTVTWVIQKHPDSSEEVNPTVDITYGDLQFSLIAPFGYDPEEKTVPYQGEFATISKLGKNILDVSVENASIQLLGSSYEYSCYWCLMANIL